MKNMTVFLENYSTVRIDINHYGMGFHNNVQMLKLKYRIKDET